MKITASDRSSLIRLASELPKGSEERRAILSGLSKVGMEFDTKEALEKYLKEHPGADKSLHSVKKKEDSSSGAIPEEHKKAHGELEGILAKEKNPERKKIIQKAMDMISKEQEKTGTHWSPGHGARGAILRNLSDSDIKKERERVENHSLHKEVPKFKTPPDIGWDNREGKFFNKKDDNKFLTSPAKVSKIFKENGWKDSGTRDGKSYLEKDGEVVEIAKGNKSWGESGVHYKVLPWWDHPIS